MRFNNKALTYYFSSNCVFIIMPMMIPFDSDETKTALFQIWASWTHANRESHVRAKQVYKEGHLRATVHWHRNEGGDECRSRGPAGMGCGGQSKGAALGMESEPVLRQPIHHLLVSLLTPTPHPLQAITDFRSWCCLLTGWGAQYKRCTVGSITRKHTFFKTIFSILTIGKFRIWRKWLQVSLS